MPMNFIKNAISWGVFPDTPRNLATKIRLNNQTSFVLAVFNVAFAILFSLFEFYQIGFFASGIAILFLGIPYLNNYKYYNTTRMGFLFLLNLAAFMFVGAVGKQSGTQYLFFPILATPFVVLMPEETLKKLVGILMPLTLFVIIQFSGFTPVWELDAASGMRNTISITVTISAFLILLFALYSFHQEMEQTESLLLERNRNYQQINTQLLSSKKSTEIQESRYRSLLENAFEGILMFDEEGIITYVSPTVERITGYVPSEVIGTLGMDFYLPDDREKAQKEYYELITEPGAIRLVQFRIKHKDGRTIWLEAYLNNLLNDRSINAVVSNFRDVTARRAQQKEIQRLIRRNQLILDTAMNGYLIVAEDGKIVDTNRAYSEIIGYSTEELLDMYAGKLQAPSDKELIKVNIEKVYSLGTHRFETKHVRKDGQEIEIEVAASSLKIDNSTYIVSFIQDISLRKENERRLVESEKILRQAQQTAKIGSWDYDTENNTLDWSDEVRKIHEVPDGYTPSVEEAINFYDEDSRPVIAAAVSRCAEQGEPFDLTLQIVTAKGKHRWIRAVGSKFFSRDKQHIAGVFQDITGQKETEIRVRESEKLYRTLAENFPNGTIFILDKDLRYVFNAGTELQKIGMEAEEFKGKHISTIHRADQIAKMERNYGLVFKGEPRSFEIPFHNNEHYLLSAIPIKSDDGSIDEIMVVSQNITERMMAEEAVNTSEQKFRKIFSQAQIGIVLADARSLKLAEFNDSFCETLGYDKPEMQELDMFKITHPDDVGAELKLFNEVMSDKRRSYQIEKRFVAKNGSTVWALVAVTILFDVAGEPEYSLAMVKDITEKKKAENRIRELNEQLEEKVIERTQQLTNANIELEAFNYTVSHDLRMPLRAASIFSGLLRNKYGDELDKEALEYIYSIDRCIHEMAQLIKDIMEFSKVGREKVEIDLMDMEYLAHEVIGELADYKQDNDTRFEVHDMLPTKGDRGMMKQVLTNLIANAIKYSSTQDQALIELSSYNDGDDIVYYVKDNGVGFDMRFVDKVFMVFERLHGADDFEGTGVGLAIVKRIINKHDGRVWAEGEVGKGATVFFTMPADPVELGA